MPLALSGVVTSERKEWPLVRITPEMLFGLAVFFILSLSSLIYKVTAEEVASKEEWNRNIINIWFFIIFISLLSSFLLVWPEKMLYLAFQIPYLVISSLLQIWRLDWTWKSEFIFACLEYLASFISVLHQERNNFISRAVFISVVHHHHGVILEGIIKTHIVVNVSSLTRNGVKHSCISDFNNPMHYI